MILSAIKRAAAIVRTAKTEEFVLSSRKGERISAVEGMKISPRMAAILDESLERGLSGDERRTLVKKADVQEIGLARVIRCRGRPALLPGHNGSSQQA